MNQFFIRFFLQIIMLYSAISAIISGSLSYAYGIGAFDEVFKKEKAKPYEVKQIQQLAKDDAKIFDTVTRVVTTSGKAPIVPNVYKITLNEFCYIIYSSLHKAPLAVHEYLSKDVITGDAKRDQKFHTDPAFGRDIPLYFGVQDDVYTQIGIYRNFSFSRGHMAAASNYNSSQKLKSSTFSLANTVPQNGYNNGGIWNTFERYARNLLLQNKCDTIEIVSGPIYYSDIPYTLNGKEYPQVYKNEQLVFTEGGLTAPPKLYKFIKCNTKQGSYASGFLFDNKKGQNYDNDRTLASFEAQTQQIIEQKTGLIFNCMKDADSKDLPKLTDFDKETLNKTKIQLDIPFYTYLFENENSINGMNSILSRAYFGNRISLDMTPYQEKIKTAAINDLNQLKKPSDSACKQINQSLNYSKDLFYLNRKLYEDSKPEIEDLINAKLEHCLNKEDQDRIKGYISSKAFSKASFKYPLQEKLREKFPPQAPKSTI